MPTRSSKHLDISQLAKAIVDEATGEATPVNFKRIAAGRKGGAARMASMTPEQRKELSAKASDARAMKEALASQETSAQGHQLNKFN